MFLGTVGEPDLHFAPLERDLFRDRTFYKHFVPTGRGRLLRKPCQKKQEVDGLFRGEEEKGLWG